MATTAGTTDRHFCWPFPRGTLLMLVMSCLLFGAHWFVYWSIEFSLTGMYRIILDYTNYAHCEYYPNWFKIPQTRFPHATTNSTYTYIFKLAMEGVNMCVYTFVYWYKYVYRQYRAAWLCIHTQSLCYNI